MSAFVCVDWICEYDRARAYPASSKNVKNPLRAMMPVTHAKTLPDTDLCQLAVVSCIWGGASSLFAAARTNRIDALVSMDGRPWVEGQDGKQERLPMNQPTP